ncbi:MAG: hypothetical protein GX359_03010 [Clostridiales bacterium]|nr:hypothetical protein [Clostridiales bacterium]
MVMRVEGNRDYPNPLITSITEKIEIADPDEVVAVGSIITMMIRGHQFYSEEEVYRCICDYFNVKYEYPKSKGTD